MSQINIPWLLLGGGLVWGFLTGIFFAAPGFEGVGWMGLGVAITFAVAVAWTGRIAIWIAVVASILLGIFKVEDAAIAKYMVALTLSINFLLFGEAGLRLLKTTSCPQTAGIIGGTAVLALSLGWLIAAWFS